jgi:hypothetical protein
LQRSGPKPRAPLSTQGSEEPEGSEGEGEGSAKAGDEGAGEGCSQTKSLQLPLSSVLNSCATHHDFAHQACSQMNLQSDARASRGGSLRSSSA